MQDFILVLQACRLFRNLPEDVVRQSVLPLVRLQKYEKNAVIIDSQKYMDRFGVVAEGSVQIQQIFSDGFTSLMNTLHPPYLLGADLICTESRRAPYYAVAASETAVLFLPPELILAAGLLPEPDRLEVYHQLLAYISNENMRKHYRLAILSQRGVRNRVLTYLTMQAGRRGTNSFQIPFSREELAAFLCVNRSKLSHELSLMEQEGLIRFRKNQFTLLAAGEHLSTWKSLK
ncbi:MAG: Crp/Fnr family transcriptional regulator [Oscillospiraceae bacterium]|nr:Crp/Fnr family transcriptional regulator [Oscillospiraceae bacterium]